MPITNKDKKYFNVAKSVSQLSDFHKCHMGCVVVYHKSIISTGCNQNKTHTDQCTYNAYRFKDEAGTRHCVHAEIDAISKIKYMDIDWAKVKVFVYRGHKATGQPMLAKPCVSCMEYIRQLGIKNVYYSGYDNFNYMELIY
jgi:deoxycytidylate deaminase